VTNGALRVALDTSFAGVNETGVGLYSRQLARGLEALARAGELSLRCIGPSCPDERPLLPVGVYREWPSYTQLFLPVALAKYRPHVVHSTSHLGPLWGPGRKVVTVHDLIFRRYPNDYNPLWLVITRAALPLVLSRATSVIVDSKTTGRDLQRVYRVNERKIRVIYPGVDERFGTSVTQAEIADMRQRLDLGDAPYLLLMGPWVRRKNLEVVIAAFAQVAEVLPSARLAITGRPAPGMRNSGVQSALESLPSSARERVRTPGHVATGDLLALVKGAAVLAYPSLYEGFGLPPLEAMSAGVPVVVSDSPVLSEVAGGAALVARVGSPREWAGALLAILTDRARSGELAAKGRERAAQFTWERAVRRTVKVYREAAAGRTWGRVDREFI
jgi:glycosyltransferase involved in cell wall biosynthesis